MNILVLGAGIFGAKIANELSLKPNTIILEVLCTTNIVYSFLDKYYSIDIPIFYILHNYFLNQEKNIDFKLDKLIKN